jgi:hypothetical protein
MWLEPVLKQQLPLLENTIYIPTLDEAIALPTDFSANC